MLTVDEIITWIKEYDNPLGDMQTFAEGLCDKVLQLNFIVPNDENAIGYAGTLGIVSESDLTDIVGELNITTSLYKTAEWLLI